MNPVAFEIDLPLLGHLTVGWYGVMTMLGFNAAVGLAYLEVRRTRLFRSDELLPVMLTAGAAALIGGHLLYQLTPGPGQGWRSGLVLYGAILGGAAGVAFAAKRRGVPVWTALDMAAAPGVLPPLVGRIGCLLAGCCYGRACDLPWAIQFVHPLSLAPRGVSLHPTQVYAIGMLTALFAFLWLRRRRIAFPGQSAMLYLGLYSIGRFVVEMFRGDEVRGLFLAGTVSFSQLIALGCLTWAVIQYRLLRSRYAGPREAAARARDSSSRGSRRGIDAAATGSTRFGSRAP